MNKRKGISTKTAAHDQSLIKYIFYNYDPEEIQTLTFTFKIGATYLKGSKAGEFVPKIVNNSNSQGNSKSEEKVTIQTKNSIVKFLDTGSVNSISSNLEKVTSQNQEYYVVKKSVQKKAMLQLFQMKLCEHIPNDKKVQQLLEQKKKVQNQAQGKNRKVQKVQPLFCKKCNQRLFYFYLEEQKIVTFADFEKQVQIQDEEQEIKNISWSVMIGQKITKTTQIAKLDDKQFFVQQNGKISFLIDWSNIDELTKQSQILRYRPIYCQHQKIQSNICQYCFEEVDPVQLNLKKFLFQMEEKDDFKREMITTGSTLIQQQNKFVDDLIERERGILILDLDNTVLHSIQLGQIHKSRLEQMQEFYEIMIGQVIYNKYMVTSCFIVKMRPFFKDFIQTAVNFYDVYVYTKGTRSYAQEICNSIRNQYATKSHSSNNRNDKLQYHEFLKDKHAFTPSRIITRDEDPDLEKKSLSNILPNRQENLMVMDDLASVWSYSSAVLNTVPFHFFFKKKIVDAHKQKNGNGNNIKRNSHKALDEHKQGQKLQPVEDLHAQNLEPVRQLACDHFEREVIEIQNTIIQPMRQLPCDIIEKQVKQIQKRQFQIKSSVDQNGELKQTVVASQTVIREESNPNLIEIKKGIAPQDKQYDYDILPRSDYYLIYAAHNLVQIHSQFFRSRKLQKPNQKKLSFGQINRKLKSEILDGTLIKFCMKNQSKIDIYWRSIKLGCKVLPSDSQTTPHYIIRLNNLKSNISRMYYKKQEQDQKQQTLRQEAEIEKETLKQLKYYSQTMKIPILSESWIQFCYSFTYRFPVQPFIIDSDDILKDVHEEDFQWIIEQKAQQLLKVIRQRNAQMEKNKSETKEKIEQKQDLVEKQQENKK